MRKGNTFVHFRLCKSTYQACTDKITPRWFLLVPRGQLAEVETRLKELVVDHDLRFYHEHYRELVIYNSTDENKLIDIYHRIAKEFPCIDVDKKMSELEAIAKTKYLKKEIEHAAEIRQLTDAHAKEAAILKDARTSNSNKIRELELQLQLLQKNMEIQELRHHDDQVRRRE